MEIDGEDAEQVLPTLTETEQYALGIKAGEILRKIHSISAPGTIEPWATRFQRKIDDWVEKYNSNTAVHSDVGAVIIEYLRKNCRILENRKQTFIHGDFNTENIIICNGELALIDFNSYNSQYGDPWWEFCSIAWTNTEPVHYFRGQIDGYFSSNPPEEFFAVLAYYCAYCALTAIADTEELNGQTNGVDVANMILRWYDNFNHVVPSWYLQNWTTDTLFATDELSVRLMCDNAEDRALLLEWLTNPAGVTQVAWKEGVPWDSRKIENAFFAKIASDAITPCIIEKDAEPIGYIQFYPLDENSYRFNEQAPFALLSGGYGVDLFIAYPELWSKGIGSRIVQKTAEYLINTLGATVVCADPNENNLRSVACWLKAGFVPLGKVSNYDDPDVISILMAYSNNQKLIEKWRATK